MLKETSAAVQAGINQHKTMEQLKNEKVLAKWTRLARASSRRMYLLRSSMTA